MLGSRWFSILLALVPAIRAEYNLTQIESAAWGYQIKEDDDVIAENSQILAGQLNSSVSAVSSSAKNSSVKVDARMISPTVARIQINSSQPFLGADFKTEEEDVFYGVWEYPWFEGITNPNVTFDLKGLGNSEGANWENARAPFFLSSAGYGVYTDTLVMGSYNFTPGNARFIFNSSSLVYYIILPKSEGDYKSIIEEYTSLSARAEMPPTSGLGPTFWSDDFEQDFHGNVSNAQENYYDVINHLYYNQIHATSMFADRPYGTGNMSFGNFDFDPKFYPTPEQFIANLSTWGFDFQVWVANRAFLHTELYNTSLANHWLFPGINGEIFQGPALNLSIPAAYAYFKQKLSYYPSVGVKGYKIDRGEEGEMPVSEQNIQMGLFEQLCYETMQEKFGNSSFFDFARSAVDRSRARTAIWNGDSHSNWTGLAYTVASGIRAGLLSFPIWGSDTGGYVRGASDPSEELWARWMWFSAFSPVYELMLGTNHTPWYPPYTAQTVDIVKQTANLHHDLIPFIKSHAWAASKTGIPIIRALFLEAPNDDNAWEAADSYFFGDEFFVAPIVKAGGSREVYFPKTSEDAQYLEYFNKTTVYDAGTTTSVSLGWDSSPVYVTQGAIVPRGDVFQGNNKWTKDWKPSLTVELYPSFDVPESNVTYFNGEGAVGKEVLIQLTTDEDSGSVSVKYGDLGAEGKVVAYVKGGTKEAALKQGGGEVTWENVETLF